MTEILAAIGLFVVVLCALSAFFVFTAAVRAYGERIWRSGQHLRWADKIEKRHQKALDLVRGMSCHPSCVSSRWKRWGVTEKADGVDPGPSPGCDCGRWLLASMLDGFPKGDGATFRYVGNVDPEDYSEFPLPDPPTTATAGTKP